MYLQQYYLECLSHASYLIGDETSGRAVVVDPRRDVDTYLADAKDHGLRIEAVVNTHFHADFAAGHLELAHRTGAWIGYGRAAGDVEFAYRPLADGDRIDLGDVVVEVLETPGHTPESISLLVHRHAGDAVPYAVLTGDALFVGDVGRPDLLGSLGWAADDLARMLYHSLHDKLLRLPDDVVVLPAHGAGSACGKSLGTERQSTIGAERSSNPACAAMTEDEFVAMVTAGQPPAPPYFAYDAVLNRRAHELLDVAGHLRPLGAGELLARRAAGALVLDTRDPDEFAARHIRGSLNVPLHGRFAERAGTAVPPGSEMILVVGPGTEAEVVTRLARVGLDRVAGFLEHGFLDHHTAALPLLVTELATTARLTAGQLADVLASPQPPVVLDVRAPSEVAAGAIPGALSIPLAELRRRIGEVPDAPVVVYCAGGTRSSIAASLLRCAGRAEVSDLAGGYEAWAATVPAVA